MHGQILGRSMMAKAAPLLGKHQESLSSCSGPVKEQHCWLAERGAAAWYLLTANCQLNASFVPQLGGSQLTQPCKRDRGVLNRLNDCVITSLPKRSSTIRAHHILATCQDYKNVIRGWQHCLCLSRCEAEEVKLTRMNGGDPSAPASRSPLCKQIWAAPPVLAAHHGHGKPRSRAWLSLETMPRFAGPPLAQCTPLVAGLGEMQRADSA